MTRILILFLFVPSLSFAKLEQTEQPSFQVRPKVTKHIIMKDLQTNIICIDKPAAGIEVPLCNDEQLATLNFLSEHSADSGTKTAMLPAVVYYLFCSAVNLGTLAGFNSPGTPEQGVLTATGAVVSMSVCGPVSGINLVIYKLFIEDDGQSTGPNKSKPRQ